MLPGGGRRSRAYPAETVELGHHFLRRPTADTRHERVGRAGAHLFVGGAEQLEARRAGEALQHAAVGQVSEAAAGQIVVPRVEGGEYHGVVEASAVEGGLQQALGPALAALAGSYLDGPQLEYLARAVVAPGFDLGRGVEHGVAEEHIVPHQRGDGALRIGGDGHESVQLAGRIAEAVELVMRCESPQELRAGRDDYPGVSRPGSAHGQLAVTGLERERHAATRASGKRAGVLGPVPSTPRSRRRRRWLFQPPSTLASSAASPKARRRPSWYGVRPSSSRAYTSNSAASFSFPAPR